MAKASSVTRMADRELRLVVLARDQYCQRCGANGVLECAHLVPRRFRRVRWNPLNAVALCPDCHSFLDTHPLAKDDWVIEVRGEQVYRELRHRAENGPKVNAKDELARLREMRRAGI